MNDVLIAITMQDGSLQIMTFVVNGRGSTLPEGAVWSNTPGYWVREPKDDIVASEVAKACVGQVVRTWRRMDRSELPTYDRTYRNAWVDDGAKIVHDMARAREVQRDRIRTYRHLQFEELDAQWMKAMGQKDQLSADAVEAQRQALRDMPADPRIDAAVTVDDLKAFENSPSVVSILRPEIGVQ